MAENLAPGWPGLAPKWTSSAKSGVGTALTGASRIWFTLSHGILNEVYYPRVDTACIRDLGLIVTDDSGFFSEEKRHTTHEVRALEPGVPGFILTNSCVNGRYRLIKRLIADPRRDVLLQHITLEVPDGAPHKLRVFALLAPHLVNGGGENTGWVGDYKGHPVLFAEHDRTALALAAAPEFQVMSVGFVGASDGWQDLNRNGYLSELYTRAENGNIALVAELDFSAGPVVIALGFGTQPGEAAYRTLSSLQEGYASAELAYIQSWERALGATRPLPAIDDISHKSAYLTSVAVMLTHQPVSFPGALIASLSIPWGYDKGDDDLGGYHLVWPRDLGETTGGLAAAGWGEAVVRVLGFLQAVQEPDGHWPQNMWLDGTAYWRGIQLDETAFPILLLGLAIREGLLHERDLVRFMPMVKRAATYLVTVGPVTDQDRWEEDPGYSPFTLSVVIPALLVAADLLDGHGTNSKAAYLRETADYWNDSIEGWTYAMGTALARQVGVEGYYVRISPPESGDGVSPLEGSITVKNRPMGETVYGATEIVSVDALSLVRFGLRAPDDPRILNTIKVIDSLLKVELPQGPLWRRYNGDGYGEHENGAAFNGTGIGRPWPLLAGERAHYELAAGNREGAIKLLQTFENSANDGGLLPEQSWDQPDIPERELFLGKPSGSAMPLVWAHAEHVKLLRSLVDNRVFDTPEVSVERYLRRKFKSTLASWRFNHKLTNLARGKILRVETREPATLHWSLYGWNNPQDASTQDSGFGMHYVDLPTDKLSTGTSILFTFFWPKEQRWEGTDFRVTII